MAPAASPPMATTAETVSAALGADLDHWAEEDASRSAFDVAAWDLPRRQRSAEADAGAVEAEPVASSSDARPGVFSTAAAFASFEPRLLWQEFLRKPTPAKVSSESDETDKGQDWEHWGLTDLLLLLAIVNLGLVLLVIMAAPFSSWSGSVLAGLASAVTFRTTRAGKIKFDKCNQAFAVLAVLLICPMFPSSWVWRDRTMMILAVLALLVGLGRLRSKGIRQPERNLSDVIGVLAFFFAGLARCIARLAGGRAAGSSSERALFLGVNRRREMRHPSDNILLAMAAIAIFLVAVLCIPVSDQPLAHFLVGVVAAVPLCGASALDGNRLVPLGHRGSAGGDGERAVVVSGRKEPGTNMRQTKWFTAALDRRGADRYRRDSRRGGRIDLWLSPRWWGRYLTLLDVRCWTPWKVVGLGIAAMQGLLVIRHWPKTKREA